MFVFNCHRVFRKRVTKLSLPFVTIGVCTKNSQTTIRRTLESIAKLDYPTNLFEVIAVDGLSTDSTLAIIQEFARRVNLRIRILSDNGHGLGHARQLVVNEAYGNYIAFVDADQYLHPLSLKKITQDLLGHPDVAAVRGAQGLTARTLSFSIPASLENYIKHVEDIEASRVVKAAEDFAMGGSIVRKMAITQVGGFDSSFAFVAEDTDLVIRLTKAGWRILNSTTSIFFHQSRQSWSTLYEQYRDWGRGFAFVTGKYKGLFERLGSLDLLTSFLTSSIFSIRYIFKTYKVTKDLFCILMPFHYMYKRAAWAVGYMGE